MNNNTLGHMIKNARLSKGLTQKEVAKLVGTTPTVINRLECDVTKKISLKVAFKLSVILELNFFELLELSGYSQKILNLEIEKLYDRVSNFKDFPYLLFLLEKLSYNNLETFNQILAQIINFSDEDKELIITICNVISKLPPKEKELIKLILS